MQISSTVIVQNLSDKNQTRGWTLVRKTKNFKYIKWPFTAIRKALSQFSFSTNDCMSFASIFPSSNVQKENIFVVWIYHGNTSATLYVLFICSFRRNGKIAPFTLRNFIILFWFIRFAYERGGDLQSSHQVRRFQTELKTIFWWKKEMLLSKMEIWEIRKTTATLCISKKNSACVWIFKDNKEKMKQFLISIWRDANNQVYEF